MSVSFVRIVAPLLLLAGIPGAAHAGLPACQSDLGTLVPGIGGTECSIELLVPSGPKDVTSISLTKLPRPRVEPEYTFEVILDRQRLEMPNSSDWFRVLRVKTQIASGATRYWAIDVNGRGGAGGGMRLVEYSLGTDHETTTVSAISLDPSDPCTRIEATWTRAPFPGAHSTLAWHISPTSCDQPDDYTTPRQTMVFDNVGELHAADIGSIHVIATGDADGSVTAHVIRY